VQNKKKKKKKKKHTLPTTKTDDYSTYFFWGGFLGAWKRKHQKKTSKENLKQWKNKTQITPHFQELLLQ